MTTGTLPASVVVYPGLAAGALRTRQTAAFGLYVLARAIDTRGCGHVAEVELRHMTESLDWSYHRHYRALRAAFELGCMTRAGCELYYRAPHVLAAALGVDHIGIVQLEIPVDSLARHKTWRAALFAAHLAGVGESPASRATHRAATGVSARSQQNYGHVAGITVIANYCETDAPADPHRLAHAREHVHPGAFRGKRGAITWQMPNTSVSPLRSRGRGRTHRANQRLAGLVNSGAGERPTKIARMYHEAGQTVRRAMKAVTKGRRQMPELMYVLRDVTMAHDGTSLFATWRPAWAVA